MIRQEGYPYGFNPSACASCGGRCCRGESGYIWVKYDEAVRMASFVNLSLEEFATMYLRKVKHRYSLREKKLDHNDYACIFFDEEKAQCGIYEVRPLQCRTFPFWDTFKQNVQEVQEECPGIIPFSNEPQPS